MVYVDYALNIVFKERDEFNYKDSCWFVKEWLNFNDFNCNKVQLLIAVFVLYCVVYLLLKLLFLSLLLLFTKRIRNLSNLGK